MAVKKPKKSSSKTGRKALKKSPALKAKVTQRKKAVAQPKKQAAKRKAAKIKVSKAKKSQLKRLSKPSARAKAKSVMGGKATAQNKSRQAKLNMESNAQAGLKAKILSSPLPQPQNGPALETHAHAIDNLQHQELIQGSETSKELSRRRIADEKSKLNQYPLEDKRAVAPESDRRIDRLSPPAHAALDDAPLSVGLHLRRPRALHRVAIHSGLRR